jgi:mannose-6-phosphate isomerase-like protein (cupin superfamily)
MNQPNDLVKIDINQVITAIQPHQLAKPLTYVNDHVLQLSLCQGPYFWHRHPNTDETMLVLEGELLIELDGHSITLLAGQLFTIPKNVPHKASPIGERTVKLTFEGSDIDTIKVNR